MENTLVYSMPAENLKNCHAVQKNMSNSGICVQNNPKIQYIEYSIGEKVCQGKSQGIIHIEARNGCFNGAVGIFAREAAGLLALG